MRRGLHSERTGNDISKDYIALCGSGPVLLFPVRPMARGGLKMALHA
jgi:hypothetical protein